MGCGVCEGGVWCVGGVGVCEGVCEVWGVWGGGEVGGWWVLATQLIRTHRK